MPHRPGNLWIRLRRLAGRRWNHGVCRIVHHPALPNEAGVGTELGTPDAHRWCRFDVTRLCAQLYLGFCRGFRGTLPALYTCVATCGALGDVERARLYEGTSPTDAKVEVVSAGIPLRCGDDPVPHKPGWHCTCL